MYTHARLDKRSHWKISFINYLIQYKIKQIFFSGIIKWVLEKSIFWGLTWLFKARRWLIRKYSILKQLIMKEKKGNCFLVWINRHLIDKWQLMYQKATSHLLTHKFKQFKSEKDICDFDKLVELFLFQLVLLIWEISLSDLCIYKSSVECTMIRIFGLKLAKL